MTQNSVIMITRRIKDLPGIQRGDGHPASYLSAKGFCVWAERDRRPIRLIVGECADRFAIIPNKLRRWQKKVPGCRNAVGHP